ncbi:MAG: class I SAM-dependent methyltransferase [Bacteroidales bacterium]|nr:class I SAM-dependent methyltransferase [Bacteroidales bacterium]
MTTESLTCWVCGKSQFKQVKKSDVGTSLNSQNFAITNFSYGITGELHKCGHCGFIQCTDLNDVLGFYVDLEDPEYENTRKERKLQETALLKYIGKYKPSGAILDIGAGSGILVESAMEKGYRATGIEPSRWLRQTALKRNLPVLEGTFPHPETPGPYDIITLVDVIEHVPHPLHLLREIHQALDDQGIFVITTPDVRSLAARILRYKWWHFRVAHIGYFNRKNLRLLLEKAGFEVVSMTRPSWYFTLRYLGVRILSFLPLFLRFPLPRFFETIIIPVNLRDSIQVVCRKKDQLC